VHPLTPKETVMHHAHAEKENEENENRHEEGRNDSSQGSLLFRAGRLVRILVHQSRLNSSPGVRRVARKTKRLIAIGISRVGVLNCRVTGLSPRNGL